MSETTSQAPGGAPHLAIPRSRDAITAQWLNAATGWNCTSIDVVEIGAGIGVSSEVFRVTTHGDSNAPATAIVKLTPTDPTAAQTGIFLKFGRREVGFYKTLAKDCPVKSPILYFGDFEADDTAFVVVMEDLGHHTTVDQIAGLSLDDVKRCVDAMAAWHATWWGKVQPIVDSGTAMSLSDPIYPAILPGLFEAGWAKMLSGPSEIPEVVVPIAKVWPQNCAPTLARMKDVPQAILHGDFRGDNIVFDADNGDPILYDFQIIGSGPAVFDLAYFLTQSVDGQLAHNHEVELFERWKAAVIAHGVPAAELEGMWDAYRESALFCLVYPVVGSLGADFNDPRAVGLINVMVGRMARSVVDLDLASLASSAA